MKQQTLGQKNEMIHS